MTPASSVPPAASPRTSNEFIEKQLDERILLIEQEFNADAICYNGPLLFGVDDALRPLVEKKSAQTPHQSNLVFLLTTDGGYIEPVQRRRPATSPLHSD